MNRYTLWSPVPRLSHWHKDAQPKRSHAARRSVQSDTDELRASKHQHHCTEHHFMRRKGFFLLFFFFKWCRRDHWDIYHPWHTVVGQRNCNMDTRRPSVINSLLQKTYLSRNTSHKVSFSCHCYISDTQQDSPDAHRQSVEMLRPLIHRNRKRKKMWKWVFGLHKRANWTNLMSEDASALTSVLSFRTVFGSLLEKLPLRFGIPTDC